MENMILVDLSRPRAFKGKNSGIRFSFCARKDHKEHESFSENLTETYRHMNAGSRIILDRTNICFHINVKNTCFLLCAPNFDLFNIESYLSSGDA
jgi:hypothetical protein